MTGMTVCGVPATQIAENTYVLTLFDRPTQETVAMIRRKWREVMGGAHLIVLPEGAQLSRITAVEPVPIYDALVAELGDPLGGAA